MYPENSMAFSWHKNCLCHMGSRPVAADRTSQGIMRWEEVRSVKFMPFEALGRFLRTGQGGGGVETTLMMRGMKYSKAKCTISLVLIKAQRQ